MLHSRESGCIAIQPKLSLLCAAALLCGACTASAVDAVGDDAGAASGGGAAPVAPAQVIVPDRGPAPPSAPVEPRLTYTGELTQGGWIRGQAPAGTAALTLDGEPLQRDMQGHFFAAFDRDAGDSATLVAVLENGRRIERNITISPRNWKIEHVNVGRRSGGPSQSFMRRRRPELAQIGAARSVNADSDGWKQDFIWPVKGRISGRFGSQRIYRGEPGGYHSGIDIATGASGTAFVAPADGVVVLAAAHPFSLEGYLLMIDHGHGLNSAFLHCSKIAVAKGDVVRQGQYIGNIGSTGRATGPHLHWSMKWRKARLDPLLFTGAMR